jgi:hypothetical protein
MVVRYGIDGEMNRGLLKIFRLLTSPHKKKREQLSIHVLDSTALLENEASTIDDKVRNTHANDIYITTKSNYDEVVRLGNTIRTDNGSQNARTLDSNGLVIDVKQLASEDKNLQIELKVLNALKDLTTKKVIYDTMQVYNDIVFDILKQIVKNVEINTGENAKERIAITIDKIMDIYNNEAITEPLSGFRYIDASTGLRSVNNAIDNIVELREIFEGLYRSEFEKRVINVDEQLGDHKFRLNVLKIKDYPVEGIDVNTDRGVVTYYDQLLDNYSRISRHVLRRLLFTGFKEKLASNGQLNTEAIQTAMKNEYHKRFSPASDTDIEVAAAYAYPLHKIDSIPVEKRDPNSTSITVITRDTDVHELGSLRHHYLSDTSGRFRKIILS